MLCIKDIKYTNKLLKSPGIICKILRLNLSETSTKPRKRQIRTTKDVEKFMSSTENLRKVKLDIPERFLKRNVKAPDDLYLVDCNVAKEIVGAIKPYILKPSKTIIETNPGFGFITEELLKAGLKEAQLYESTVCFRNHILNLDKKYPNRLKLYSRDFFSIWRLSYQDRHDNGDRVRKMLSNIKTKKWSEDPAMTIIGSLASSNFIRHLILSLIFQFGVMTYGRCELFLILPPSLYFQLTAQPNDGYMIYRPSSALFQIFCDHKILLKMPRNIFLPWDSTTRRKKFSKLKKLYEVDTESMYLIRIEFKKTLPVPPDKLQHLWYFVNHVMLSRSNKVIPIMEKWVPDCGIRLILSHNLKRLNKNEDTYKNINIFTEIGQLNPQQILKLYKDFSNWPEYNESTFIPSLENVLLKMESMQNIQYFEDPVQESEESSTKTKYLENIADET